MDNSERIDKARERVIDSISKNMDLFGVTPSIGRLYGTIYFHDQPMTLENMGEALGMSKTSMSTGVRTLSELKLIRKAWKKGSRKDLYKAEEDWYQSFIYYFSLKWRNGINLNKGAIQQSLKELNQLLKEDHVAEGVRQTISDDIEKLNHALEYYDWLGRLVDSLESQDIFKYIPKKRGTETE